MITTSGEVVNYREYHQAHSTLKQLYGSASEYLCVDCGGPARDWSYTHHADPLSVTSFRPRCTPCHSKYDAKGRRERKEAGRLLVFDENGTLSPVNPATVRMLQETYKAIKHECAPFSDPEHILRVKGASVVDLLWDIGGEVRNILTGCYLTHAEVKTQLTQLRKLRIQLKRARALRRLEEADAELARYAT